MKFKNPENGYTEHRPAPWLGALFFGGLYFMASGLWAATIVWLFLAIILYASLGPSATILMFFINLVYAAMANGSVRNNYLRKGWVEVVDGAAPGETELVDPINKKCPFCAEMIKAEAIICRYCGKDQPPPPIVEASPLPVDYIPMGACPNCNSVMPLSSMECSKCKTLFGELSLFRLKVVRPKS